MFNLDDEHPTPHVICSTDPSSGTVSTARPEIYHQYKESGAHLYLTSN